MVSYALTMEEYCQLSHLLANRKLVRAACSARQFERRRLLANHSVFAHGTEVCGVCLRCVKAEVRRQRAIVLIYTLILDAEIR